MAAACMPVASAGGTYVWGPQTVSPMCDCLDGAIAAKMLAYVGNNATFLANLEAMTAADLARSATSKTVMSSTLAPCSRQASVSTDSPCSTSSAVEPSPEYTNRRGRGAQHTMVAMIARHGKLERDKRAAACADLLPHLAG